jgi:pimeloyl-ACP methyl ester carboxylesterase
MPVLGRLCAWPVPKQPLATFLQELDAVITHDLAAQLGQIKVPTQITFGRHDVLTSTRFADRMIGAIRGSELLIFEECSHAPIYEKLQGFNQKILAFLRRYRQKLQAEFHQGHASLVAQTIWIV